MRCSSLVLVIITTSLVTGLTAACDTWLGSKEELSLTGQRLSILVHEHVLKPDTDASLQVILPSPRRNESWPQTAGDSRHAMHHLEFADSLHRMWRVTGSRSVGSRDRMLASPIVAEGRVYIVDIDAVVHAIEARSGTSLWAANLLPEGEESDTLLTGGIAYEDGRLFITTGWGEVVALRADTGIELWRRSVGVPVRAAPTVSGPRVFVLNKENEVRALATESGTELWRHRGMAEVATLLGGAAPAVEGSVVVAALSSGELVALRAENGNQMWSDSLAAARWTGAVANLADILAPPVIDHGRVYALGHSGVMVAIDLRSGQRIWEVEIGGAHLPWVSGDFLFVLTNDSNIVAMDARRGRIIWVRELPRWQDPENLEERVYWTGLVLAGHRLIVAGSHGKVISISPYTGTLLGEDKLPAQAMLPPVVANGMVYFLVNDGTLIAYR